jgi:hypothetical protein
MKISNVNEMRELDRTAMEVYGIKEELLMENAGEALYFVILNKLGIEGKRFVFFAVWATMAETASSLPGNSIQTAASLRSSFWGIKEVPGRGKAEPGYFKTPAG